MRFLLGCAGILLSAAIVQAQVKPSHKKYVVPPASNEQDYTPGKVLVKIKKEFRDSFLSGSNSAARSSLMLAGGKVKAIAHPEAKKVNAAVRSQAFKPAIDIALYYEVSFDPTQSVEDFINTVYATGYVEFAEPLYRERMQVIPNDPAQTSQYYLEKIKAYQAWDITQGSEAVIIAIIDSGVDIDHPDLANQLYINVNDPVNGVDDDNNGYIDDYRGWDFSGADTLNAFNPNFLGDNNPGIPKGGAGFSHGTQVGAAASASTNDGVGMAGVGYKTKLLFTKHFADNQPSTDRNYSSNLYIGILYAAEQGARIINCSWGSDFRSQVYQDIITHVTVDLGCLVIGAAGNDNVSAPLYPAAYDYVLSVAGTNQNDQRATFSNSGSTIDISAPGVDIYTATFNDSYGSPDGTSFSAPIVAGAAALVMALHPTYTGLQVGEQLRVTADESMYIQNPTYTNQLGKGRLDIYQALTQVSPSIRALRYNLINASGNTAGPGDKAFLYFDFINYLESSSGGLEISISTTSTHVAITKNKINPGAIASGATIRNALTPFELTINNTIAENSTVDLLITYSDGAYKDFQIFTFIPNPSFRNIDDNKAITSISSAGRLGYEDPQNSANGIGFVYNDESVLYEMGVIMGSSTPSILNAVRNGSGGYDQDFVSVEQIKEITPGDRSYSEVFGKFSNHATAANQTVVVTYRSLVWRDNPYDKFVIVEYKIKNPKAVALSNFYFGLFADWDISFNGGEDASLWNTETQLGYVYPKQSTSLPHAGIQLLTTSPNYYAIDNNQDISGNPFGIYDGFSDAEKFTTISTTRATAGNSSAQGNDVSHVVSAGPFTIAPNQEITIAFALHAADNFDDLLASAKYADSVYNFTLQTLQPVVANIETCYGAPATLTATGATKFKWYENFTGGSAITTGPQFDLPALLRDTTLYVSNAENTYESLRTPAHVVVRAKPQVITSRSTALCESESVILSVEAASSYAWSNGATTQSIVVSDAGAYSVDVTFNNGILNCQSTSEVVAVSMRQKPAALFSSDNGLSEDLPFHFTDASQRTASWFWDFGDGSTSEEQSPTHTFEVGGLYSVKLTVTAENGCQDFSTTDISVVTGLEKPMNAFVQVYPVPATEGKITLSIDGLEIDDLKVNLLNSQGMNMYEKQFNTIRQPFSHSIETQHFAPGIYFLKVQADNNLMVKKVLLME